MQSSNAATRIGEVDRDLMRPRVKALLEMCARADVDSMSKYFAPDIVYTGGTWRVYPLSTPRSGREACAEMIRAIHVAYENLGTIIRHTIIDGDRVAVCRTTQLRNRGTGRIADVEIWDYIRFRDGLVVEFSEYPDTHAIASLESHD